MSEHSLNVVRVMVAIAGLVASPAIAFAVPVTWEAQGSVDSSNLSSAFFASFMPELAGTQAGESLVLRISFDTAAEEISRETGANGGTIFSFDPSSLQLALEVPGRGVHVFAIDDTIPPDHCSSPGSPCTSLVLINDDLVTGAPALPIIDSLLFLHEYLTTGGDSEFLVRTVFSSSDTSIISGGILPRSPDPRFSTAEDREITILDSRSGNLLVGTFSSLVRLPSTIPEPGSLALLCLGLAGFRALRRDQAVSAA
jgi:PEP-CTERM motif